MKVKAAINPSRGTIEENYELLLEYLCDPLNQEDISLEFAWQHLLATRNLEMTLENHIEQLDEYQIQLGELHWMIRIVLEAFINRATELALDAGTLRKTLTGVLNQSHYEIVQRSNQQQRNLKNDLSIMLKVEDRTLIELFDSLAIAECKN